MCECCGGDCALYGKTMRDLDKNNCICFECGITYGAPTNNICTFHDNVCGWCNKIKAVTHYRNYSYPSHLNEKDTKKPTSQ